MQRDPDLVILTDVPDDVLYAVSSIGLVDLVEDDVYAANNITRHMHAMPSAQHGALHLYVHRQINQT